MFTLSILGYHCLFRIWLNSWNQNQLLQHLQTPSISIRILLTFCPKTLLKCLKYQKIGKRKTCLTHLTTSPTATPKKRLLPQPLGRHGFQHRLGPLGGELRPVLHQEAAALLPGLRVRQDEVLGVPDAQILPGDGRLRWRKASWIWIRSARH